MTRTRSRSKTRTGLFVALVLMLAVAVLTGLSGSASARVGFSSTTDLPPYFGGDQIFRPTTPPYAIECTSGFQAFDHGGGMYALAAGHCGGVGEQNWQTGAHDFGPMIYQNFTLDTGVISEANPTHNWGYFWLGTGSVTREVYSWETTAQDAVGNSVCYSGSATAHEVCGTVSAINQPWLGYSGAHAVKVICSYTAPCVSAGDSGAPAYAVIQSGAYAGDVEAVGTEVGAWGQSLPLEYGFIFIPIRYEMQYIQANVSATFNLDCLLCS